MRYLKFKANINDLTDGELAGLRNEAFRIVQTVNSIFFNRHIQASVARMSPENKAALREALAEIREREAK